MGDGLYLCEYRLDSVGMFSISLTMDGTDYLRKLEDRVDDTIKTLGWPTWIYGDLFQLEIGPAPMTARESTVEGDALTGGVTNEAKTALVFARDALHPGPRYVWQLAPREWA